MNMDPENLFQDNEKPLEKPAIHTSTAENSESSQNSIDTDKLSETKKEKKPSLFAALFGGKKTEGTTKSKEDSAHQKEEARLKREEEKKRKAEEKAKAKAEKEAQKQAALEEKARAQKEAKAKKEALLAEKNRKKAEAKAKKEALKAEEKAKKEEILAEKNRKKAEAQAQKEMEHEKELDAKIEAQEPIEKISTEIPESSQQESVLENNSQEQPMVAPIGDSTNLESVRITENSPEAEPQIFSENSSQSDSSNAIVGNILKQAQSADRKRLSREHISFKTPKKKDEHFLQNFLGTLVFLMVLISIVGYLFFYIELNLENDLKSRMNLGPSVGKVYQDKKDKIEDLHLDIKNAKRRIAELEKRYEELDGNLTYTSLDFLPELKRLNDTRVNWGRALEGLEVVVSKAGGAQEFLKQLTFSGFTLTTESKQITLGSPTVRGVFYEPETADIIGSSISLATQVLELFEESEYFKDLNQLSFSKSEITNRESDFGLYQNYQTPVVLNMTYQEPFERDCRDEEAQESGDCFNYTDNDTTIIPLER